MNRWKVLPHRRADHSCRECGRFDVRSAPKSCTRCGLEHYSDAGFSTIVDPVSAYEREGREMWRDVSQQLRFGQIRSDRFYVFVGDDDDGPLRRPVTELLDTERELAFADVAHEVAIDLTRRHRQVWVVTTVGSWNVTSGPLRRDEDAAQ